MKIFGFGQDSSQKHSRSQPAERLQVRRFMGGQCLFAVNTARETIRYDSRQGLGLYRSGGIEVEGLCIDSELKGVEVDGSFEKGDMDDLTRLVIDEGPLHIWPNDLDETINRATVCGRLNVLYLEENKCPSINFEIVLPTEVIEPLAKILVSPFGYLNIGLWTARDFRGDNTATDMKDLSFLISSFEVHRGAISDSKRIERFGWCPFVKH